MTKMTVQSSNNKTASYAAQRKLTNTLIYIILSIMVVIWIFPIFWLKAFKNTETPSPIEPPKLAITRL